VSRPHPLDPVALTETLVAIDSRNPSLVAGAPGEQVCAEQLADVLHAWGFAVRLDTVAPGRANVMARIGPAGVAPLVLNGHLDVVGTDGMTHPPFTPTHRDGSLYARGATDMKGGVAAMCVAAARAARGELAGELIITAVCDEEFGSIGTAQALEAMRAEGIVPSGAVITEPTRLAIVPAHKGFVWMEVQVEGRAAHGSRYDVGIDANRRAAQLLMALDTFEREVLTLRSHPRLGRASLHVPLVQGGTGWSTYADRCLVRIERRTLPGEPTDQVLEELAALVTRLQGADPSYAATVQACGAQPPLELDEQHPLVHACVDAARATGLPGDLDGLTCWTDAALFASAGIPALCFGPGDIARAHAATEWVEVAQIEQATAALERLCLDWARPR
jgi:acetylornithine deacetylase